MDTDLNHSPDLILSSHLHQSPHSSGQGSSILQPIQVCDSTDRESHEIKLKGLQLCWNTLRMEFLVVLTALVIITPLLLIKNWIKK